MRRKIRRRAIGLAVTAAVAASVVAPWTADLSPAAQADTVTKSTYKLAPGVTLTRIRHSSGPQEIRLLTVVPSKGPRLDIGPSGSHFPMWRLTSANSKGIGGIAGVNGDFATPFGAPSHFTMIDGEIWTTGFSGGEGIGVTTDGSRAFIGNPYLVAGVRSVKTALNIKPFALKSWNAGNPFGRSVGVYTQRGGAAAPPPGKANPGNGDPYWCGARLAPLKLFPPTWSSPAKTSITRRYKVTSQPEPCKPTPMSLGTRPGNVVLAARANLAGGTRIKRLKRGDLVKLSWGIQGWPGVTDVMGGNPMIIDDGKNIAPPYTSGSDYVLWNNPRTSVGITGGCTDALMSTICKLLVLTVDGRQTSTGWSKGWQLPALANELLKHHAKYALNFDGGGTTVMWAKRTNSAYCQSQAAVGGCLVNRPSPSSGERQTIESLVVLPGRDAGTPGGLS